MVLLTQGDVWGLVAVYDYIGWVLIVTYLLRDRIQNLRKVVHVLTGGIVFFWWLFDSSLVMAGLAAFPFVIITLLSTPRSPVRLLRESPLGSSSAEGHPYGLVMYSVSWTLIALTLFDDLFAASIAIAAMSFGDGMGEVIGRRYGRTQYMPHRTLEGSLAVFLATTASILVLYWFYFSVIGYSGGTAPALPLLFAPSVGFLVCFVEAVTPGAVDNLVIPLFAAGFLHMMGV